MNQEIKARWVRALRSGEYLQGSGMLCLRDLINQVDYFCCLGVLCDLAEKDGVTEGYPHDYGYDSEALLSYEGMTEVLPKKIQEWAGLTEDNPVIPSRDARLATLNDEADLSFEQIADLIEQEL